MPSARYDVLGIGNAIVDVIARAEEDFLLKQGMRKGTMALIDEARAEAIYDAMGSAVEVSGGSAANTIVGLSSLGGRGVRTPPRLGGSVARPLLRAGDARRRAHHEHISGRCAGSASRRYRCRC